MAAVVLLAAQASAAPAPQLTDPKGDTQVAAGDIVSATFSSGGARTMRVDLVVAAAPAESTPYSYEVRFTAGDCNYNAVLYNHPVSVLGFSKSGMGCDTASSSLPAGDAAASGSTITFKIPLSGALKKGVVVRDITAATSPSGLFSGAVLPVLQDTATTTATYTIGR